jgi:hypothetical protein
MSTSLEKKREAVAATFGIPVDPEDVNYTNFLFQRRHLATVPDGNGRELAYVAELDELEHAIIMGLDRIRARAMARKSSGQRRATCARPSTSS